MSSSLANLASGGDTVSQTETVQNQSAMARPLRMAVTLREGVECQRYGVQYDQTAGLALFQQTYSLLAEASAGLRSPSGCRRASGSRPCPQRRGSILTGRSPCLRGAEGVAVGGK